MNFRTEWFKPSLQVEKTDFTFCTPISAERGCCLSPCGTSIAFTSRRLPPPLGTPRSDCIAQPASVACDGQRNLRQNDASFVPQEQPLPDMFPYLKLLPGANWASFCFTFLNHLRLQAPPSPHLSWEAKPTSFPPQRSRSVGPTLPSPSCWALAP